MNFEKTSNISKVWANICNHEGEIFYTVRKVPYKYVVKGDYIWVNGDSRRRITKESIEKALEIENPTCSKIGNEGIWGPSYIFGIITDNRII